MRKGVELRTRLQAAGWRVVEHDDDPDEGGLFAQQSGRALCLQIICSWGGGWDHVSVSFGPTPVIPSYQEMEMVRKLCFEPDEVAMQLGVPEGDHVNNHPGCLHWWRPQNEPVPLPPGYMV